MIFGLIGSICTGKQTFVDHLKGKYNFRVYNIQQKFYETLPESESNLSPEEKFKLFYSSTSYK